jgi:hypothetical protein
VRSVAPARPSPFLALCTGVAALLCLGLHCDSPCPDSPREQRFQLAAKDARGAQVLPWTLRRGQAVRAVDLTVRSDRSVMVLLVRSTVRPELEAARADPGALRDWLPRFPSPLRGVHPLVHVEAGGSASRSFQIPETDVDALMVVPLDPTDAAPYAVTIGVRQHLGEPRVDRGHHGQCVVAPPPPLPMAFEPLDAAGTAVDTGR